MEIQQQPTQYPTRAALVAAFLSIAARADARADQSDDPTVAREGAQACSAALKCGYLTPEEQRVVEDAHVATLIENDGVAPFGDFMRQFAFATEAAGEPTDTPKPTTVDATEIVRHGLVSAIRNLVGVVRRAGVIPSWVLSGAAAITTTAITEGFISMEQVAQVVSDAHGGDLSRGNGTPASFIACQEEFARLIAESHDAPARLVCYTNDGPKDEYPVKTLSVSEAMAASALFGGATPAPRRNRKSTNNSPVA